MSSRVHKHARYGDEDCGISGKKPLDTRGCSVCCSGQENRIVMSPPPYSDLGKHARDVFSKGYHFGLLKLDVKSSTSSGVEFSSGGVSNQETGKVFGSLETKYKIKEHGLTFSEKWNTDNTLAAEVSVADKIAKGLKLSADCSFAPQTGNKTGRVKTSFANDRVALNCDMDLFMAGPIINTAAVVGYQGWMAGYQTGFDSQQKKVIRNNFALGFSTGDFVLHTNVDDGQEFGGSIFQKVSPYLSTGVMLNWSAGSSNTRFAIGADYHMDADASVRAKVNNASQVGLGYQQKLRDGVTLSMSVLIDGKNFNSGGHKFGAALELEA